MPSLIDNKQNFYDDLGNEIYITVNKMKFYRYCIDAHKTLKSR